MQTWKIFSSSSSPLFSSIPSFFFSPLRPDFKLVTALAFLRIWRGGRVRWPLRFNLCQWSVELWVPSISLPVWGQGPRATRGRGAKKHGVSGIRGYAAGRGHFRKALSPCLSHTRLSLFSWPRGVDSRKARFCLFINQGVLFVWMSGLREHQMTLSDSWPLNTSKSRSLCAGHLCCRPLARRERLHKSKKTNGALFASRSVWVRQGTTWSISLEFSFCSD